MRLIHALYESRLDDLLAAVCYLGVALVLVLRLIVRLIPPSRVGVDRTPDWWYAKRRLEPVKPPLEDWPSPIGPPRPPVARVTDLEQTAREAGLLEEERERLSSFFPEVVRDITLQGTKKKRLSGVKGSGVAVD